MTIGGNNFYGVRYFMRHAWHKFGIYAKLGLHGVEVQVLVDKRRNEQQTAKFGIQWNFGFRVCDPYATLQVTSTKFS